MELIPILSTIILVATISTFILAVGAYILYKIREGKTTPYYPKDDKQEAEIVEPVKNSKSEVTEDKGNTSVQPESKFNIVQKSTDKYKPVINIYQDKVNEGNGKSKKPVQMPENKYLKYTPEGFEKTEQEGDPEVFKWR